LGNISINKDLLLKRGLNLGLFCVPKWLVSILIKCIDFNRLLWYANHSNYDDCLKVQTTIVGWVALM